MSTLLQEIEAQIAGVKTATAKQNVGVVREIGDGVAKIEGLTDAMLNEMLDFGNGVVGLALNLRREAHHLGLHQPREIFIRQFDDLRVRAGVEGDLLVFRQ